MQVILSLCDKLALFYKLPIKTLDTHQVSAIVNVAQKVNKPWPLNIIDYDGVNHEVILKPGDVLWYESARWVIRVCHFNCITKLYSLDKF